MEIQKKGINFVLIGSVYILPQMLERFRTFATENYEKCLGCGHYPINNDRAVEWIVGQPAGCARAFAELFYASLRHVSFNEWYTVLCKIAVEILTKIEKRKYSRVVLVITGKINKSNTWVAVLLFHHIGKYITDVVERLSGTYPADTLFLHTDDCTYSGNQIYMGIYSYERVVRDATYVIVCPFIGSAAYETLKTLTWVKFPKSSVIFDSFQQQVENNTADYGCDDIANKSMAIFTKEISVFQFSKQLSAIYFDHKLADNVSIFQKILALGPVHNGAAVGSLISGCESFTYKYMSGKVANASDPITNFDDNGVCPKAFYKTIKYTYNGAPIDSDNGLSLLMRL